MSLSSQTLLDIRFAARDSDVAGDEEEGVTHLERRDVTSTSTDDEDDFLAEINREREKRKIKKFLKKYPNISKAELLDALRFPTGETDNMKRKDFLLGNWHKLVTSILLSKTVRRMIICWKSKTFLKKSSQIGFMTRKLYDQNIKEGKDMDEKTIFRMSWQEFSLRDEARIDYKALMKHAKDKTRIVMKASKGQKREKKVYTGLKKWETGKMRETNIMKVVKEEVGRYNQTCLKIDEILHSQVDIGKKVWNPKLKKYINQS
jgi:hypothetical protein